MDKSPSQEVLKISAVRSLVENQTWPEACLEGNVRISEKILSYLFDCHGVKAN